MAFCDLRFAAAAEQDRTNQCWQSSPFLTADRRSSFAFARDERWDNEVISLSGNLSTKFLTSSGPRLDPRTRSHLHRWLIEEQDKRERDLEPH